ncbi:MAG: hypothetical protein AAGF27_05570 [Pseudomonadota bacterium]
MHNNIFVPIVYNRGVEGVVSLRAAQRLCGADRTIALLRVMEEVPSYTKHYLPSELAELHHVKMERAVWQISDA